MTLSSPPPARQPRLRAAPLPTGSRMGAGGVWAMARRVTAAAGVGHAVFLVAFVLADEPQLALFNVGSVLLYLCAWVMLRHRVRRAALWLVGAEVLAHAAVATLLLGWGAGFHYYVPMMLPAVVMLPERAARHALLGLLAVYYVALHILVHALGPAMPPSPAALSALHACNVLFLFGGTAYVALYSYEMVRRAERRLLRLASLDPLTGLYNRRHLEQLAGPALSQARRLGLPSAVMLGDIDHFKRINDRHGHEAGDQVLQQIGALIRRCTREHDIVARWGGEEFLLLLPGTDLDAAAALADRLRAAVHETAFAASGLPPVRCTLSLGAAAVDTVDTLATAVARADRALYASKHAGRNRVSLAPAAGREPPPPAAPVAA